MGLHTPLYTWHQSNNGKLVDFSGWDMPVNYGSQIEEHHAVRQAAGMFDVSHMTVIDVRGSDAKVYLQTLLANDVARIDGQVGKALYTGMLNSSGGVVDDLIVYNMSSKGSEQWYRTVVNCGTREKDLAWMAEQVGDLTVDLNERNDLAMIAVQGPQAIRLHAQCVSPKLADNIASLAPFEGLVSQSSFYARTGYTGEDGLEIILPATDIESLWVALFEQGVKPCGLGARDTLRLEAGMNLYGHEMDDNTSPLVANMAWTIAWEPQERDFIGRRALLQEKANGIESKLVGLVMKAKGVLRAGQSVIVSDGCSGSLDGVITSGTFSPSLGYSIALARVPSSTGSQCQVNVRNKWVTVDVVKPCFVRAGKTLV